MVYKSATLEHIGDLDRRLQELTRRVAALEELATRSSSARGTRLPADWSPRKADLEWALAWYAVHPDRLVEETQKFVDYWVGKPGRQGVKLNWDATFRNWLRRSLRQRR